MKSSFQKTCLFIVVFILALQGGLFWSAQTTYGYFSTDTEITENRISTGTLEFDIEEEEKGWKPGDELKPGREIIREIDIKNSGTLDFKYDMSMEIVDNEDNFCDEFILKVKVEGDEKYNGDFIDFDYLSSDIESGDKESWKFILSRGEENSLSGVSCDFDIVFKAWQKNMSDSSIGFTFSDSIDNEIVNCDDSEEVECESVKEKCNKITDEQTKENETDKKNSEDLAEKQAPDEIGDDGSDDDGDNGDTDGDDECDDNPEGEQTSDGVNNNENDEDDKKEKVDLREFSKSMSEYNDEPEEEKEKTIREDDEKEKDQSSEEKDDKNGEPANINEEEEYEEEKAEENYE